jgi:hypothetical protein
VFEVPVMTKYINPLTPNDLQRRHAVSPLKIKIVFVIIIVIIVIIIVDDSGNIQSSSHCFSFPNEISQNGQNYFLCFIKNRVNTSTVDLGYNVMQGLDIWCCYKRGLLCYG